MVASADRTAFPPDGVGMRSDRQRGGLPPGTPVTLPPGYVFNGEDKFPEESPRAFRAFAIYRDLGKGRTYAEVMRRTGASSKTVAKWALRYHWKGRTAAHEEAQIKLREEALREAVRERSIALMEDRMNLFQTEKRWLRALEEKLSAMMSFPLAKVENKVSKDGKTIITRIEPARWSFHTAVEMLSLMDEMSRRNVELPTTYSEVNMNLFASGEENMAHLSDEERAAHMIAEKAVNDLYFRVFEAVRSGAISPDEPPERVMARLLGTGDTPETPQDERTTPPDWYKGQPDDEWEARTETSESNDEGEDSEDGE